MIEWIMKYIDCNRVDFPRGLTKDEAEIMAQATERNFGYRLPDELLEVFMDINGLYGEGGTLFCFMTEESRKNYAICF